MTAPPPSELRTERLVLRRWRDEDREPFAAMNADPRVMEFFPSTLTRDQSDGLIERLERSFDDDKLGLWAVEAEGRFVGFTGLLWQHPPLPFAPAVEVGWRLATEAWGHGYASEAAAASLDDGFTRVGLSDVVSMTAVANLRSRRVMERLGMRQDPAEDFDHPSLAPGHPLERHVLYRLAADAWRSRAS
ncbi:MAG: GNAT family N-acetyltransferase [Solirubrobacteraceae bacterium]|nr:GNAT family N-acetyltransferase [Solirubrobacteraceae bacterium]